MTFITYKTTLIVPNRRVLFLLGFLFLFTVKGYSQITLDSITRIYDTVTNPDKRLHMEMYLAEEFMDVDLKKSDTYFKTVKSKLDTIKPIYVLRYHLAMSIRERIDGNPDAGIKAAHHALEIASTYKDSARYKAKAYNSLGSLYDDKSNIPKAIENHLIGLRYAESIDYKPQIATICNGLGRAYLYISEYDISKKYYKKAIKIKEELNQYDINLATSYQNLSICYDEEKDYEKSLQYLNKAISIRKKYDNYIHLISSYNNKAFTLLLMKRYKEAQTAVERAIKLADSLQVTNEKMYALSTYAEILFAQNKIDKAETLMSESIRLSKKNNDLYLIKYNLDLMYDINVKKGNYKKALVYFKEKSIVLDSVNNVKSRKVVEQLALEYETEKKDKAIELLNMDNELNAIKLKKSNKTKLAYLLTALLSFVIIGLLISRHKNKIKTEALLKESMQQSFEKQISDSELQTLRAQMNPHFLFNCLNSINSFIIKNEQEKASEYLSKFSLLIRKVLNNSKEKKVTLANELEALGLYIELEALRFNHTFEHEICVAPHVEKDYLEVPPLIIQPYVENSIWHGLLHKKNGTGLLTVQITQEEHTLVCRIEDNGIGREAAKRIKDKNSIKQQSFGMNITKQRLQHVNEKSVRDAAVVIEDLINDDHTAAGTRVTIKITIT